MLTAALLMLCASSASAQNRQSGRASSSHKTEGKTDKLPPQAVTAWDMVAPLGLREPVAVDTLLYNYFHVAVPSLVSPAYASTGNLGSPGINMIYMERKPMSDFFFRDAITAWIPRRGNHVFYNSRIPMTLLSYNTGGGRDATQDRLKGTFSGNVNKRIQIGAMLDYLYSKGSYADQADKDMAWGASGSYLGDRYQLQAYYNHYHMLIKENGGIVDDLYILDPAQVQGGTTSIKPKSIPTRLTGAHSRIVGGELMVNQRYNIGYSRELTDSLSLARSKERGDTLPPMEFVPVSSIIWTLNYEQARHGFVHDPTAQSGSGTSGSDASFWANDYLMTNGTEDRTSYWSLNNTVGLSMVEGFHPLVKFGLSAFVTHSIRRYNQTADSINFNSEITPPDGLTPYPYEMQIAPKATENLAWIGGQLTKQRGRILHYEATARFGFMGRAAGDVDLNGLVSAAIPLGRDSLGIEGHGSFANTAAPYLMDNYVSNHFIWHNDFGHERRLRFGGSLGYSRSGTRLGIDVENIQNYIYFDYTGLPAQYSGSIQVLSASLDQRMHIGVLNWDNKLIWQKTADKTIMPLPELALYSNLYLRFVVARVLDVQLGVDCNYYTKYYAPDYQPATMAFTVQNPENAVKVGGYPFMNAYANFKLSKTRFYVLYSHMNQGLFGGNNYFAMPHYPMNPRRLQFGLSVDFTD